jgi:ParB/RepB/Spo0J family partition protein
MITEQSPFQYLRLSQIVPSRTNKRRIRQDKLQELADNIKANGVMQPILVRPIGKDGRPMLNEDPDVSPDHYEIVAGERRFRASQLADQPSIPAMVRELHDLDALQLQVFENLHRDDLHPMEEAEAFEQLHKKSQDLIGLSVDELALKVHKSRSYIYASLKLLELCTYARDAFFDGKIGKETSVLVARIPGEKLQTQAVKEIVEREMSFRTIKQYIRERFTLDLAEAPWDMHSKTIAPKAGCCFSCPKRSGNYPELCTDIESPDVCTDPDCYAAKRNAHIVHLQESGRTVLQGEEAEKVAPYGIKYYITNGYCTADRGPGISGLADKKYVDLLGDDMPEPIIIVDKDQKLGEIYLESQLKEKLQEKIAAGELVVPEKKPLEPSEWEIKRQEKQRAAEIEQTRREKIFMSVHGHLLNEQWTGTKLIPILKLAIEIISADLSHEAGEVLGKAYVHESDYVEGTGQEIIDRLIVEAEANYNGIQLITILAAMLAAEGTVPGWGWEPGEDEETFDRLVHIAGLFGIEADNFKGEETASTPPPAAQAVELPAEVDQVDEPPAAAAQASEPPSPAAPADEDLPPEFAEIKAKALAKKARRQEKKESATADGDQTASTANAAEETSEEEAA